jgi:hypothetical protein
MPLLLDLTHEKWYISFDLGHQSRIFRIEESFLLKHIDDVDREAYEMYSREVVDMTAESISIYTSLRLRATQDRRYTSIS